MNIATYLDQAPEGNVLCALNFEQVLNPPHSLSRLLNSSQALQNVLSWLRQEQDTVNRYLHSHPSIREPVAAALRGIVPSVPPPSPAPTPRLDDEPDEVAGRTQHKQLDGTGRDGSGQSSVPCTSLLMDGVGRGGGPENTVDSQRQSPEGVSETRHERTPSSTQPEHDRASTPPSPVRDPERVGDHREGVEQIEECGSQLQTQQDVPSPASPSPEPQPPAGPPSLKRKQKRKPQTAKRQRRSKGSLDVDPLPEDVTRRVHDIATLDDIVFLRERLQLLSSTRHSDQRHIHQDTSRSGTSLQTSPRRQRLEMLWSCIGDNKKAERWARVLQRICQAEFLGQYLDERSRFTQWQEEKQRQKRDGADCRATLDNAGEEPSHPLAEYVDLCFPPTGIEDDREKAKKKFENFIYAEEPWVKFNERFGKGIFIFTSAAFRTEQ